MKREEIKQFVIDHVKANVPQDEWVGFMQTGNGSEFLCVEGWDVGLDIKPNGTIIFDVATKGQKSVKLSDQNIKDIVKAWISNKFGDKEPIQKTCDNCKLFTDFGACMKMGYNLTRCIKNNYSEFEAKD